MAITPINISGATTIVGFNIAPPFLATDNYTFSFPYISTADFEIEVNSETILDAADFEFTSTYLINLTATGVTKLNTLYGTEASVPMTIRRRTQLSSKLVDYTDGGNLTEEDLDLMSTQLFYLIQEVYDTTSLETVSFNPVDGLIDIDGAILADIGDATGETHAASLKIVLNNVITPEYTEGDTYRQYRMVFESGDLYRANKDIASAPAVFNGADWDVVLTAAQLAQIATNTADIATNTADIATNTTDIGTNTTNIGTNTTDISNHVGASNAHGTTGDVVGTTDAQNLTNKEITSTVKLEPKHDTYANLVSYAASGSGTDGQFCFATDQKVMYQVVDGALSTIGGGGGGLDVFLSENFEVTTASDFTTGNNTTPDTGGTGTLAGALANETVSMIAGARSIKFTQAVGSLNDFFVSPAIILDRKQKGNFIGVNFYSEYNGDDDDIRFFLIDELDNEIEGSEVFIKANSASTRYFASVFIPDTVTSIRYGCQVSTENSGAILKIDDVEFSTNPFVYKDLIEESHLHISQDNSAMTNLAGEIEWNLGTATINTGGEGAITTEDDSGNTRTKFIMGRDGHVTVNWGFKKQNNATVTEPHVNHYNSAGTLINEYQGFGQNLSNSSVSITISFEVNAGDFVCVEAAGNSLSASGGVDHTATFNLRSTTEHVVTPAKQALTGWELYTPTNTQGFGTPTTTDVYWRQVGDSVEIQGYLVVGTTTADEAQIELPNSYTIKNYHQVGTVAVGVGTYYRTSAVDQRGGVVLATQGDTFLNFGDRATFSGSANIDPNAKENGNAMLANGDGMFFNATVQVEELSASATFLAAIPVPLTAYVEDIKTTGTAGGAFNSGAWQTRDLTTVSGDSKIVTLSSNEFTLQKGAYYIEWDAPAYDCGIHQSRLYDVTASASIKAGTQMDTEVSANVHNISSGYANLVVTSSNTYKIEHRCTTSKATTGFGVADTFSEGGVFTRVKITKIK